MRTRGRVAPGSHDRREVSQNQTARLLIWTEPCGQISHHGWKTVSDERSHTIMKKTFRAATNHATVLDETWSVNDFWCLSGPALGSAESSGLSCIISSSATTINVEMSIGEEHRSWRIWSIPGTSRKRGRHVLVICQRHCSVFRAVVSSAIGANHSAVKTHMQQTPV